MRINKIKCYNFSNHFLMSLHAQKSIVFVRLRYPVGNSAQGSNPKVTVDYSITLLLEFLKTKGRKKAGEYVNIPSFPLTPSSPNLCSVCFLGFKIKNMQMSFLNEQNFPKERLNCHVSNSKMHHVISDQIAVTIKSIIQNWAPSNWENLAKRSICNYFLCAFGMQIGNYRAYSTIQRNKFRKMTRTCEESYRSENCRVRIFSGIYGFMVGWLLIWWFENSFSFQLLCFDSCFPRWWKYFVTFGIATSFEGNLHLFPVELTIYYARFSERFVFFLSITW